MKTLYFANSASGELRSLDLYPHKLPTIYNDGQDYKLGYFDCRLDLLFFICDVYGWEYEDVILIDICTYEALNFEFLADEQEELYNEEVS